MEVSETTGNTVHNDVESEINQHEEERYAYSQAVCLNEADLEDCQHAQLGNRSEFHGPVNVSNFLEVTRLPDQYAPGASTSLPFTNAAAQFPIIHELNAGFYGIPRSYHINAVARNRDPNTQRVADGNVPSTSEQEPLLRRDVKGGPRKHLGYCFLMSTASFVLILVVVLVVIYGHEKKHKEPNLPANFTHIYRDRTKWLAEMPKKYIPKFKYLPPNFVIVSHTVSKPCNNSAECSVAILNIQAGQMARQFDDIAYNFLVAGDGLIYEGRGWIERSAGVPGMECSSMHVAFVGNFSNVSPPKCQLDAFKILVNTAENNGKLIENYKMFMQSDIMKTESPGRNLTAILKKWPNWAPFSKQQDFLCN